MRLSANQSGRQAGRQSMRQAGVQAETPSWGLLVSACISKPRRGSLLQQLTVVEWTKSWCPSGPAAAGFPDRSASRVTVYPSAVVQTRVQIPLSTNFDSPPDPPKKWYPKGGRGQAFA